MAKKRNNQKIKRRFALLIPICWLFIGFFCYTLINNYTKINILKKEGQVLNKKIIDLKEEEEALKVDIEKLNDPDYVGRYAREQYLYTKTGEFIIKTD